MEHGHSIGEGLTFVGSAALVAYLAWQARFVGPGILCVVVAFGMYFFCMTVPQTLGLPAVATGRTTMASRQLKLPAASKSTWQTQVSILKLPSIWVLALASATMYMTVTA